MKKIWVGILKRIIEIEGEKERKREEMENERDRVRECAGAREKDVKSELNSTLGIPQICESCHLTDSS